MKRDLPEKTNLADIKEIFINKELDLFFVVQVSLFLRESWVDKLSCSIQSNLRNIGRGAYNLKETCWEMYKMSKLYRLMAVVHYNMQDSLRHLVQDSLVSLWNMTQDACCSVLTCPQDLVWGDNLINSPYK